MRAIVTVDLAYEQDLGRGMSVLATIGERWATENPDRLLEAPEVQGVLALGPSGVGVRLIVKVPPGTQAGVERELRLRIKDGFDREGIEIPFGRQVVYLRQSEAASA
jgi:small conductance mechanosensitive channel